MDKQDALRELELGRRLVEAGLRLIRQTKGAASPDDVSRLTGRPWQELLAEEAGIPIDTVRWVFADAE